jgi:hypothetical protein
LPALAFGSHYFVFKERPGTHLSSGVGAGCPKDCTGRMSSAGKSPSVASGPARALRRDRYCTRCGGSPSTRRGGFLPPSGTSPDVNWDKTSGAIVPWGGPPRPTDHTGSPVSRWSQPRYTDGWHTGSRGGSPYATRCRSSTGFPLPPLATAWERAPSVDLLELPPIATFLGVACTGAVART